jgi:hypothetical protein
MANDFKPMALTHRRNGHILINSEYGHEKEDGVKENTFEISSIVTYGLLDNMDIVLSVPF